MIKFNKNSIVFQTIVQALIRISIVAFIGSTVSYVINLHNIESKAKEQLHLSTHAMIQREAIVFEQTMNMHQNFLNEFNSLYNLKSYRNELLKIFDQIYQKNSDGSYTQRTGIFEGQSLADGRRFPEMSATYSPEIIPNSDTKVRLALSFLLCYKYGSSNKGQTFNIYGVVPEKGFPAFQNVDIGKAFTYQGSSALNLNDYEFYTKGFDSTQQKPFLTKIYYDFSSKVWMTTLASPGPMEQNGKRKIVVGTDIILDKLIARTSQALVSGTYGMIINNDSNGTIISSKNHINKIIQSNGEASIRSLGLSEFYSILEAKASLKKDEVKILNTDENIIALGLIPGTDWILSVVYPKDLMLKSIRENILIIVLIGIFTLIVEIILLRRVLRQKVAIPLNNLVGKMRNIRKRRYNDDTSKNEQKFNEIDVLLSEFEILINKLQESHDQLEQKVNDRTLDLKLANEKLMELSNTDPLTGIGNRRHFDKMFELELNRAKRSGKTMTLIMGDVDWFKKYNDQYGHQSGDECLKEVANCLKNTARRSLDTVARYSGEEFIILLCESNREEAEQVSKNILESIRTLNMRHEGSNFGFVTMSLGVAVFDKVADTNMDEMVKIADLALYRAKKNGRNCFELDFAG